MCKRVSVETVVGAGVVTLPGYSYLQAGTTVSVYERGGGFFISDPSDPTVSISIPQSLYRELTGSTKRPKSQGRRNGKCKHKNYR